MIEPLRICITGAAGQIGYSLVEMVASGSVFGYDTPLILLLLDITPAMNVLKGITMELADCALPLVKAIIATDDPAVAFKDIDAAFLVASMPLKDGMERSDLLKGNFKIFKAQGEALNKYAKKDVKVLVVGNPVNTNALTCSSHAPSIPKENFSALTRLDQNRTQAQIAERLGIPVSEVKKCCVWGNHSSTQYPDVRHATAILNGKEVSVYDTIKDENWLNNELITIVRERWHRVTELRKHSSGMSAAKASCDHMRDWWQGTPEGTYSSMGVVSNGEYGTPAGIVFSFPTICKNKKWTIVQGLPMNDFAKEKLELTAKDLINERAEALALENK